MPPPNPYAFPLQGETNEGSTCSAADPGMELRDYFAAHALNGLLLHYHGDRGIGPNPLRELANISYRYADEMLAAREKGGE